MFGALRLAGGLAADAIEALIFRPLGDPQRDSRWPHGRDWDGIPDAEYARDVLDDDETDIDAGLSSVVTYLDEIAHHLAGMAPVLEDIRNLLNHGCGPASGCAPTPGAGTLDGNVIGAAARGLHMWLAGTPCGQKTYWQSIADGLARAANDIRAARDAVAPK